MRSIEGVLVCLRFFSRFPLPATTGAAGGGLAPALPWVPVAGFIIGLVAAVVLLVALAVGLPPPLAAVVSIATLVVTTGALHEDGLADCADGFGGGGTIERKLAIMRDSRIGTFGACALALSLLARTFAIGAIAGHSSLSGAVAIIAAATVSRAACLVPLLAQPPARPDGLAVAFGRPDTYRFGAAALLASGLGLAITLHRFGVTRAALAIGLAFLVAWAVGVLARRQIGGVTGDVAGAAQQLAEITALMALSATPPV